ncbi:FAD-binding oxidoreductase [Amycolatopsis sp. NPDC051128]|uniref:FAD-binding oxidoreductase n=1 Tax=Amycolatopsis sp. NPDC051128 TaxID=3155412 RepID=UPI003413666F
MASLNRRGFLSAAAATGGLAATQLVPGTAFAGEALTQPVRPAADPGALGAATVYPGDPRYADLVRGGNLRFVGKPDYVRVVTSVDQVVDAVQQAVRTGRKVAVRSGGHCYENFVADPAVGVVIDMSELNGVHFDPGRRAFAVEAGATLGDTYRRLFKGWGVTIPAGNCPTVGAGGHILGGGYGTLSRQFGLVVDHLYAVEVVVVDPDGRARLVVATREPGDPNRELWWAHAGGGGGNFGVVTKYWLRSPGATGADPAGLLPKPPSSLIVSSAQWSWGDLDEPAFTRIVKNFSQWYERNSAPDSVYTHLTSQLKLLHRSAGSVGITTQIDNTLPNAEKLLNDYYSALTDGIEAKLTITEQRVLPWWHASLWNGFNGGDSPLTQRYKAKSGYLRKCYSDERIHRLYQGLNDMTYKNPATLAMLVGYGGRINAVGAADTAVSTRSSVLKFQYATFWLNEADDATNIDWLRRFYRDVHSDTGGVPVVDEQTDGAFINYVDVDLADPKWNTSGVPWSTLYYGDNYPRLQKVKQRWDSRNVFNHAMSVRLP